MNEKTDYTKGANLTFENATRLFKAAEVLENSNEFAIANSLMVLAAEEAVKAFIIININVFPESKNSSFNASFTDHKSKLKTIKSIRALSSLITGFVDLWFIPMLENLDKPKEERPKHRAQTFNNLIKWLKVESEYKDTDMSKESQWWDNAKTIKESGFYVGINNGKWLLPTSITRAKYMASKKYVSTFLEQVKTVLEFDFNSEEFLRFRTEFETLMVDAKTPAID
jgi:AbiV family abortive infection protein